jgi:hypothetical protein
MIIVKETQHVRIDNIDRAETADSPSSPSSVLLSCPFSFYLIQQLFATNENPNISPASKAKASPPSLNLSAVVLAFHNNSAEP